MYSDFGLLILRLAIGGIVIPHGLMKLGLVGQGGSVKGIGQWFHSLGMRPGIFWAVVVVLAEAGGGLLTLFGLGGPLGPGILAADLLVVTIVAHWPQGFWAGGGKVGWEFPLPLAAGALAITLIGSGNWSLDAAFGLTYSTQFMLSWLALMVVGVVLVLISRAVFAPKQTQ